MTVKPGHKTTEFVLVALVLVGAVSASLAGTLPPRWAALAAAVSSSSYAISRAITKAGAGGGS